MDIKIGKCTCTGKDLGYILGGAAVGGVSLAFLVGGWMAQQNGSVIWAWLGYSLGLAIMIAAKIVMHMGMHNGCPVHSMHGMMAMMEDKPRKNGRKKR